MGDSVILRLKARKQFNSFVHCKLGLLYSYCSNGLFLGRITVEIPLITVTILVYYFIQNAIFVKKKNIWTWHFWKCHFRKRHSWKCQIQNFLQKCQNGPSCHFWEYVSENDTFESVILESVKIESVRVDRQPHSYLY